MNFYSSFHQLRRDAFDYVHRCIQSPRDLNRNMVLHFRGSKLKRRKRRHRHGGGGGKKRRKHRKKEQEEGEDEEEEVWHF